MSKYFIYTNQIVRGPFELDNMAMMYADGRIESNTPVSTGRGMPWQSVSDRPEILAAADKLKQSSADNKGGEKDNVVFYCPQCNQKYSAHTSWQGHDVVCVSCGNIFTAAGAVKAPELEGHVAEKTPPVDWSSGSGSLICPHCWYHFNTEDILYIAAHPSLMGDPVLGPTAMRRFAPVKFNSLGQALDEMNQVTDETACPRCRLKVPLTILDEPTYYFSLVGAPSSGKSYYLATLLHSLRSYMTGDLGCTLLDVDPELNQVLDSYEDAIFHAPHRDEVAILPKTQQTGDNFVNVVELDNVPVHLPKPFIYEIKYLSGGTGQQDYNIIFYDNAGEQFQPGADNIVNPGTRHLACSNGIIFIFDPVNDALMRDLCDPAEPQLQTDAYIYDQTRLLSEMIARIRRHRNLSGSSKCNIPLVIAVGKYDAWKNHFSCQLGEIDLMKRSNDSITGKWDKNKMLDVSLKMRDLLLQYAPGLISSAEAFFEQVYIVPFSSFGCSASTSAVGQLGVIPNMVKPIWAANPFMALLAENGLVNTAAEPQGAFPVNGQLTGTDVIFKHPATQQTMRVPGCYAGAVLDIDGRLWKLPENPLLKQTPETDDLWS